MTDKKKDLFYYDKSPHNPYKALLTSILRQAWDDSKFRFRDNRIGNKTQRIREAEMARNFLTGNYSREMMEFICQGIGIDPNYIIRIAMTQSWAKDYKPKYF